MNRLKLVVAIVAGAAIALFSGQTAFAETYREHYLDCVFGPSDDTGDLGRLVKACCEAAGGTFVVDRYTDGMVVYRCEGLSDDEIQWSEATSSGTTAGTTGTAEQPEGTWTNDTNTAASSGTAEQQPNGTWTYTYTTSTEGSTSSEETSTYESRWTTGEEDAGTYDEPAPCTRRACWYD